MIWLIYCLRTQVSGSSCRTLSSLAVLRPSHTTCSVFLEWPILAGDYGFPGKMTASWDIFILVSHHSSPATNVP